MEYRYLGKTGLMVSALSLGSWTTYGKQVGEDAAEACLTAAYDAGINLFDTAEGYAGGQAEEIFGRIFKKHGWRRDTLVISTKLFWGGEGPNQYGLSRKHIREGIDGSLRRLGVDYVDFCFCHRPDPNTPLEETARAMDQLVRQGKVLYWGTSCWSREQITESYAIARRHHLTPPSVEQPPYNLIERERVAELAGLCKEIGLGLTTYGPLFGGVLSGKYSGGTVPKDSRGKFRGREWVRERIGGKAGKRRLEQADGLARLAEKLGAGAAPLATAWCLKNPNVSSVITGATRVEQLKENLGALELVEKLTDDVLAEIDALFAV